MIGKVLVDTNILVYAYDIQWPRKQQQALDVLDTLIKNNQAMISAQVLSEFFVVVTRKLHQPLPPAQALISIDRYIQCVEVLPVTASIVREAARAAATYQISYWDAQIWATAHLNQIPTIVTEDIPSASYIEGVSYYNPFA